VFTDGCVKCVSTGEVCLGCSLVGGRGMFRVFTGGCVKCMSTGEVCLGCSLLGVWSVCLRERCI